MSDQALISPEALFAEPASQARSGGRDLRESVWNPEDFVREQIRGLIRRLFFSKTDSPMHQIVFCAAETEGDVRDICWRVGQNLALETGLSVAVVGQCPQGLTDDGNGPGADCAGIPVDCERAALFPGAIAVNGHLWHVPPPSNNGNHVSGAFWQSYLSAVRDGFEYSIINGPAAAHMDAAAAVAEVADGVVLVVSAKRTRRATARKIKDSLEAAQACVLGVVLSDRSFPIPEWIYRRF